MSEITAFFQSLAERPSRLDDLYSVTYALCKSCEKFRQAFLSFCFEEEVDTNQLIREYNLLEWIPYFRFYDKNHKERIIEVKVDTAMDHFKRYEDTFLHAKHALIANHKCKSREGWVIKTWREFYEKLNNTDLIKNELVKGYVEYLKIIICVKEFKKMNLNMCKDLTKFYDNLEVVVRKYNFTRDAYIRDINEFTPHCYGRFFHKAGLNFWFGLYFEENTVYLGFSNDDIEVPLAILKKLRELEKDENFEKGFEGRRGFFWFSLDKERFKILCDDEKPQEMQLKVLEDFFTETMKKIGAEEYLD